MNETFLLAAGAGSVGFYVLVVWLTRAASKRALAALAGGVLAGLINIGLDDAADRLDWWRYPFASDATPPLAMYLPVVFLFGAAFGLLGWRVIRALEWTGVAIFFATFVGLGVIRDHVMAAQGNVLVFGPGLAPHIADALGYLSLALAVQLAMLALVGKPQRDAMRAIAQS